IKHNTTIYRYTENEMKAAQETNINLNLAEKKTNQAEQSYVDLTLKEVQNKHGLSMDELKKGGYKIITPLKTRFQETAYNNFKEDEYFPGNTEGEIGRAHV